MTLSMVSLFHYPHPAPTRSYHPRKITARRMIRHKIRAMTERTIEVVAQKPLLQALAVEDMEAAQFADFLGAVYLVQTDGTRQRHIRRVLFLICVGEGRAEAHQTK